MSRPPFILDPAWPGQQPSRARQSAEASTPFTKRGAYWCKKPMELYLAFQSQQSCYMIVDSEEVIATQRHDTKLELLGQDCQESSTTDSNRAR